MPKNFIKLFVVLLALSLVVFAIGAYLSVSLLQSYYLPVFPWLLLFFFLVNAGVLFFRTKSAEGKATSFPRYLMAINGAKIFAYLIFMLIYVFLFRENARDFLIAFMMLYLLYFIFDLATSKK